MALWIINALKETAQASNCKPYVIRQGTHLQNEHGNSQASLEGRKGEMQDSQDNVIIIFA